jgi:putative Holliday junction resolvase
MRILTKANPKMNQLRRSIIALDYGQRRVGVAGCTGDLAIAFGITTLIIDNLNQLIGQLEPIFEGRQVREVVIGFPMTLGDRPGTLKDDILALRQQLLQRGYAVYLVDEALSSRQAGELLRERGRRSDKEDIDRTAAALILQQYLDGELPPLGEEDLIISPS